jgi:simple sugar transport system permease protein
VGYNALAIGIGVLSGLALVAAIHGNLRAASFSLLLSPVSSVYDFSEIFVRMTVLLIMGLGIAFGLRAGVWNVGAEGQYIVGSVLAIATSIYATSVPPPLRIVLMLLAGAGGGLIWIFVPALLKAKFGANEIVVTLLLNLVASNFLIYALNGPIQGKTSYGYLVTDLLPADLRIPKLIPYTRLGFGFIIALGLVVVFYVLTERTSFGLQVRTVGKNLEAAKYAGISIPKVYIVTMLLAGAMAGLAGAIHVSGVIYSLDPGYPSGYGYIAIVVAMLGGASVIGTTIASLVVSYLVVGAESMQANAQVPFALVYTVEGIILFSLAGAQYLMGRTKR